MAELTKAHIPHDVWHAAEVVAKEATRDAMRDPLMPYYITVTPHIARAIVVAKAEERELAARIAEMHDHQGVVAYAIRSRSAKEGQ